MVVSPYVFKSKAVRALKGNWQTALLVTFFASLPMTLLQLLQATRLPDLTVLTTREAMEAAVLAIPSQTWMLLGLVSGFATVLSPVLAVGCNAYFIRRLQGEEPGFWGLFSRMRIFLKALLLYIVIYVRVFLWSLLLVVPGIMAALRYALAPFYLAEHPEMGVLEAIRKSKEAMQGQKTTLFMLELSFLVWLLGAMAAEVLLSGLSVILALVASQFIQLVMATYLNAACAGFYRAACEPGGVLRAQTEAAAWLRNLGGDRFGRPFGNDDNSDDAAPDENAPDGEADAPADAEEDDAPLGEEPDQPAPPEGEGAEGTGPDGDSPRGGDPA